MNNKIRIIPAMLGIGFGLGLGVLSAEGASRPSGAYAWMRRLFIKGGDAAVDEAARHAVTSGAPHEEYELTSKGGFYWDLFWGTFRGEAKPSTYRTMWLDPVTESQNFETHTNQVLANRFPFYYELHNRNYRCRSSGDPNNSHNYGIQAGVTYFLKDRVVKAMPGHEVFQHPVRYEIGLTMIPASCFDLRDPFPVQQVGSTVVPRGGHETVKPYLENADVRHVHVWYDRL